jgi:hypothetical protein
MVAVGLVVGCTGSDGDIDATGPDSRGGERRGEWVRHDLGAFAADREIVATTSADGVVALIVEESGRVRAWTIRPDGSATEASVDAGTSEFRTLSAAVDGPGGLVATGNDWQPAFTNFVLTSNDDGATWSERPMAGISAPMEVLGLISTNNGYVAVGALRTAQDPSVGPFEPAIATSPDGTTWARSQLPATGEGVVTSVTDVDGELMATGRVGDQQELSAWRSADSGATWSAVEDFPAIEHVASSAGVVVGASPHGEDPSAGPSPWFRSDDRARTWTEGDPDVTDGLGYLSLSADSSGFSLVAPRAVADPWSSPDVCYADPQRCSARSGIDDEVALISPDAVEWQRLDLAAPDELARPSSVVRDAGGNTVLLGTTDDAWAAWFWSTDQGAVPTIDPDERNDAPTYSGPALAQYGATLEVGKRYAYPFNTHCGMDRLGEFNDRQWRVAASSPSESANGMVDEDWPMAAETILGFLTLTEPERIEYSLDDGTVIAVYEPLPLDTPEYGCD